VAEPEQHSPQARSPGSLARFLRPLLSHLSSAYFQAFFRYYPESRLRSSTAILSCGTAAPKQQSSSSSVRMATSIDEKHAADFEATIVTDSELPTPSQGINRAWSAGSYPRLSEFMGLWPEVAIFRRFGALNAQNLLFLQAELAHLERELKVIREREEKQEDERGLLAQRSWFELSQATEDGEYCPQWTVIQDIRSKLSEYSMAIQNRPFLITITHSCLQIRFSYSTKRFAPFMDLQNTTSVAFANGLSGRNVETTS
jgi:hypothetical protein